MVKEESTTIIDDITSISFDGLKLEKDEDEENVYLLHDKTRYISLNINQLMTLNRMINLLTRDWSDFVN